MKATTDPVQIGSTNRDRRRVNEAELVRIQREGRSTNEDDLTAAERPQPEGGSEPLVRDPALTRALDLLKGIAIVERSVQR